jgi:hypothetical protein
MGSSEVSCIDDIAVRQLLLAEDGYGDRDILQPFFPAPGSLHNLLYLFSSDGSGSDGICAFRLYRRRSEEAQSGRSQQG